MSEETAGRVKEIFADALELPPDARQSFLESACAGDSELVEEVSKLLSAHAQISGLLRADEDASIQAGAILCGRYRVNHFLGRGGMGEVYEAFDQELTVPVALKVLRSADPGNQAGRLRREVQLARQITHPNVCRVFDYHRHDGPGSPVDFISMELLSGRTLSEHLASGSFSASDATVIACQICDALAAAHRKGIVHRDLKPSNIMLMYRDAGTWSVSVMDFGLAREAFPSTSSSEAFHTESGQVIGTPAYIAPEQLRGDPISERTDIYALGVVLYELFTGVRPFQGDNPWATAWKRLTDDPLPPTVHNPALSAHTSRVILTCLQRDPAKRFSSVDRVHKQLTSLPSRAVSVAAGAVIAACLLFFYGLPQIKSRLMLPLPKDKHLVVLPFSGDAGAKLGLAFNDGLSQTVASQLSSLRAVQPGYWVVPFSDVKRQSIDSPSRARTTSGANLALIGTLARGHNSVQCDLKVIDTSSDRAVRSQHLVVPDSKRALLGQEISVATAAMLDLRAPIHFGGDDYAAPGAYEFYEQGNGYLQRYGTENLNRAISLFERAIELDPKYIPALAGLAQAYASAYYVSKDSVWLMRAQDACARALAIDPSLATIHLTVGILALNKGDAPTAIRELERARELDSSSAETLTWLARAYDASSDPLQAEVLFQSAINLRPSYWEAFNNLGEFYFRHAQYAKAERLFRIVTELTPDNALGFSNLGGTYLATDKYAEAVQSLQRAVELRGSPAAYSNLGTAYLHVHRYDSSVLAFHKAIEGSSKDYRLWRNLGDAISLSHAAGAQEAFGKCAASAAEQLRSRPENADLLSGRALCLAKLGERELAKRSIERALHQSAVDGEVRFRAALVFALLRQPGQAMDQLRESILAGYPIVEIQDAPELAPLRDEPRFKEWMEAPKSRR
jgi:eukaryotic-like serine/threonine-protein kinase